MTAKWSTGGAAAGLGPKVPSGAFTTDPAMAIAAHRDAAAIFRETRDRHREGRALNNLGLVLREVRRF